MRTPRRRLLATAAVLLVSAATAGCGAGDDDPDVDLGIQVPEGTHEEVVVIDGWVKTLSRGDVTGAAEFFALPSIAENGTPPLRLSTRRDAVAFNRSLPCGATLVRAQPDGELITATFRLTERPGGDCGSGVGGMVRTSFRIEDGKITEWRRLPDAGDEPDPGGPVV
jgi:hypothetical protein